MRLSRWARAALLTGIILLTIGVIPLWGATQFWPGNPPVLFAMAFFLLAPLGSVIFGLGLVLALIAKIWG